MSATRTTSLDRRPAASTSGPPSPDRAAAIVDILAPPPSTTDHSDPGEPACFRDLNLDQLVATIVGRDPDEALRAAYHRPCTTLEAIDYRHEVLRDLERPELRRPVATFAERMERVVRLRRRTERADYQIERQVVHLQAATAYLTAVRDLLAAVDAHEPSSRGLRALRDAGAHYLDSPRWRRLVAAADEVAGALTRVRYRMRIVGDRVHVSRPREEESEYADAIASTFARFALADEVDPPQRRLAANGMNHVEAGIVSRVARLYPEEFAALARFESEHRRPVDPLLRTFARDVRFYLTYLDVADRLRSAGLPMCYPQLHQDGTDTEVVDGFDAALAVSTEPRTVVTNDVRATGIERLLVVTGPNQGGKTTYARMVGQLGYLASLGLPVPGRRARLPLTDQVLTLFDQGENLADLRGALEDELVRMREILRRATPESLVIVNEVFSSTSVEDASVLASDVLGAVVELGCRCVCVTFLDELSRLSEHTVSLVSQVDPQDVTRRTFRVERRAADGRAYAVALARSYGLVADEISRRVRS